MAKQLTEMQKYWKEINKTARYTGCTTKAPTVPRTIPDVAYLDSDILDYGAGKHTLHTIRLREMGYDVTPYDVGDNIPNTPDHPLKHRYDVVMLSNVLNVQPSESYLIDVLCEAHAVTKRVLVCNYPKPRKSDVPVHKVEEWLGHLFHKVDKKKNGVYVCWVEDRMYYDGPEEVLFNEDW